MKIKEAEQFDIIRQAVALTTVLISLTLLATINKLKDTGNFINESNQPRDNEDT